ncbi:MauE/DoxX family redox-associated membrane protein [Micromonospora sp. NPDC004336]
MSYVWVFGRCLLALVFLASAAGKLRGRPAFRAFADSLRTMDLLPARTVVPVAGAVVAAEAVVPVLLLAPLPGVAVTTAGFALAVALLVAFTVAIAAVLSRGTQASCRCFGEAAAAPFGRHHLARNVVLTVVAGIGVYAASGDPGITVRAAALSVPLGVVGALVVVRLDDLVALFSPAAPAGGVPPRGTAGRAAGRGPGHTAGPPAGHSGTRGVAGGRPAGPIRP